MSTFTVTGPSVTQAPSPHVRHFTSHRDDPLLTSTSATTALPLSTLTTPLAPAFTPADASFAGSQRTASPPTLFHTPPAKRKLDLTEPPEPPGPLRRRRVSSTKQDFVESSPLGADKSSPSRRFNASLGRLTSVFVDLLRTSGNSTLDLNMAVDKLNVQKRRIYDITNVLEGSLPLILQSPFGMEGIDRQGALSMACSSCP